jgi:ribosomal protein S25
MVNKGRSTRDRKRPGTGPAGARNCKAVLTPEIVKQIREDRQLTGLSIYKIAAKYGIGKSQAYNIISNAQWKGVS